LQDKGAHLWAEYSRPHLYYSLRKLEEVGLVSRAGNEASNRKVYSVTAQGREELRRGENREQLMNRRAYFDFDLILAFAEAFASDQDDFAEFLTERRTYLEAELEEMQEYWQQAEMSGEEPFGRIAVMRHRIKFLKSELDFLKWLERSAPEGWKSLVK
jgi:DNA-binding PadR family transcriptional regulator